MAYAGIDNIVQQINDLIDQQLLFLERDLQQIDDSACQEYGRRFDTISRLCHQLDRYSAPAAGSERIGA